MAAKWKRQKDQARRERVGAIVRSKFFLHGTAFDRGIPEGTTGIVTQLDRDGEPYVEFECGELSTLRPRLSHWMWLEIIG